MKRFLIAPSILSANFAKLGEDVTNVISAGADILHFDVMDNHYVPNLSVGSVVLQSLRSYGVSIPIDVHLMAKPIDRLISDFAAVGANYISFHPEATEHIDRSLQLIKEYGCKAGLVFNPSTTLNYLEYVMDKIDLIILMSVNPGFSGQLFIPMILNKIRQTRKLIDNTNYNIDLAVDGGINIKNIHSILKAGATTFIIGSAIFGSENYYEVMHNFRSILSNQ
ncbi:ribulose-phosphate 3-epimerase [Blochmannia endosymbiont of Camponotus modoc]|uniref:ribulose-phosphate 3-epimerase n=1 Tax=Blochmannia endosymbiont of Camponotus modoc TaxID=2945587 RepID=UPI00202406D6|nr:ribulose-phosphate 3-epimerase [Blochmannia endosymbiont of Camponotus modoc]URJ29472.1 ribulose-phosphate 3-epimerase [Blochmannia endosymbiont of Camponotus modoc]